MIWLLRWLIFGPPKPPIQSCKEGGPHKYTSRYDEMIDPRLDKAAIEERLRASIPQHYHYFTSALRSRIYVKDICDGCGDVVERLEGLNAMQVIAYASKRINE